MIIQKILISLITIASLKNILLGFLFLFVNCLSAQNRPHIIYNQTNGLLSDDVYGVAQDDRGYIWFTSKVGVSRFDGNEFIHYSVLDGLPTNFSWRLFHDSQDRIWLFNNLTPFTYIKNDSIYRVGNKIEDFYLQSIVEDADGNIHFNQSKRGGNRLVYTTENKLIEEDKNWYLYENDENKYYYTQYQLEIKSKIDSNETKIIRHYPGAHHFVVSDDKIFYAYPLLSPKYFVNA